MDIHAATLILGSLWGLSIFLGNLINAQESTYMLPPIIDVIQDRYFPFEPDETAYIRCKAKGQEPISYYWKYNGRKLQLSSENNINILTDSGDLYFSPTLEKHEGFYQCFASNDFGTAASQLIWFRLAELDAVASPPMHDIEKRLGDSVRLLCPFPRSYPPAIIKWARTMGDKYPEDYIVPNERMVVDPEGGLNIIRTTKEDDLENDIIKTKGYFFCVAYNEAIQTNSVVVKYRITTLDAKNSIFPKKYLYATESPRTFYARKEIRLFCIYGGNPSPDIEWRRSDGKLFDDDRTSYENFGKELLIKNVKLSDEGIYECWSYSADSITNRRFEINILAAPAWVTAPKSVIRPKHSVAKIRCVGEGKPTPQILWYINGVPLSSVETDVRRSVNGGTMTLRDLRESDTQTVQCNVTNVVDYLWGEAYISVHEFAPVWDEVPPAEIITVEGFDVFIPCRVRGSPTPVIVWYKDDVVITGGFYSINDDGLLIKNVQQPFWGVYVCTATSKNITIEASGILRVARPTQLIDVPRDLRLVRGEVGVLTCSAVSDPRVKKFSITWKKDGHFIAWRRSRNVFLNPVDFSLVLTEAMVSNTGIYTCVASNGLDSVEASCRVVVEDIADPPVITGVSCDDSGLSVGLSWIHGNSNNAPLIKFAIFGIPSRAPTLLIPLKYVNDSNNPSAFSTVVNVKPGDLYHFRISSHNRIGWSRLGPISTQGCVKKDAPPPYNPRGVTGWGSTLRNMVIYWNPMPPVDHYGGDFHYIVQWRRMGSIIWNSKTIRVWKVRELEVNVASNPFTKFEIKVSAVNIEGAASPPPNITIGFSGQDEPTIVVKNFRYVGFNERANTATFEWDAPVLDLADMKGAFFGFRIEFWVKNNRESIRKKDFILDSDEMENLFLHLRSDSVKYDFDMNNASLPRLLTGNFSTSNDLCQSEDTCSILTRMRRATDFGILTKAKISNLVGMTTYEAVIRILNFAFAGRESLTIEFTTPDGEPGPVESLSTYFRGSTSVGVQWLPPQDLSGSLIGYAVSYQTVNGFILGKDSMLLTQILGKDDRRAKISGLISDTEYRISIYAQTAAATGEPFYIHTRTLPETKPSPPSFTISSITETGFVIHLQPSTLSNPGSIFYAEVKRKGNSVWYRSTEVAEQRTIVISQLDPAVDYEVRLVAVVSSASNRYTDFLAISGSTFLQTKGVNSAQVPLEVSGWFWVTLTFLLLFPLLICGLIIVRRRRADNPKQTFQTPKHQASQRPLLHSYVASRETLAVDCRVHVPDTSYSSHSSARKPAPITTTQYPLNLHPIASTPFNRSISRSREGLEIMKESKHSLLSHSRDNLSEEQRHLPRYAQFVKNTTSQSTFDGLSNLPPSPLVSSKKIRQPSMPIEEQNLIIAERQSPTSTTASLPTSRPRNKRNPIGATNEEQEQLLHSVRDRDG